MSIDASLISYVSKNDALSEMQRAGVSASDFVDEYQTIWKYLVKAKRDQDTTPSPTVLRSRFPDLEFPQVKKRDVPILLRDLRQRRKYIDTLTALNEAASTATSYESVDDVITTLMGRLNELTVSNNGGKNHIVDLFSPEVSKQFLKEMQVRRSGKTAGIPTGFGKFDRMAGGLQKQKMVVIIGRPGLGKSWMDLMFVASAVMNGKKCMLYPLEMTLFETAARLYTLFSSQMFGQERVLKNYALTSGQLNPRKVGKFLNAMEDKFKGQLYVADVGSLSDPYTNERVEAEVEMHKPDMFWIDYLTLMKSPVGGVDDWGAVRALSNGVKNTAMRRDVVGGCSAQVNRSAMSEAVFLPRLEHIAYGDSIGQDADQVISINRKGNNLFYALVKNRGGPEIGKTRVRFHPDIGRLDEVDDRDEEDDAEGE